MGVSLWGFHWDFCGGLGFVLFFTDFHLLRVRTYFKTYEYVNIVLNIENM